MFDNMPSLSVPKKSALTDELTRYLSTSTEKVSDPLLWWVEKRAVYPCLSRMALDYLSIPGLSFIFLSPITIFSNILFQLHPSMLNVFSAKAASYYHISETVCLSNRHALSFALGHGVNWALLIRMTSRQPPFYLMWRKATRKRLMNMIWYCKIQYLIF